MRDSENTYWVIAAVLVLGIAGALWYLRSAHEAPVPVEATPPAETSQPANSHYPVPEPATDGSEPHDLVPLPPLDDSDAYFRIALVNLFGDRFGDLLVKSDLIEKSVTALDNLTHERIAERIRPLGRLPGSFVVVAGDNEDTYVLSPENYSRYDALVGMLASADISKIVDTYRRFYPLLQQAYVNLGYPDGYFNDRVVAVIDDLLATPEPEGPIRLVRPNVLYQFADPDLEALSSGRKLLLRMGQDNAARVEQALRELRGRLTELDRTQPVPQ
jgi:Protein of unknown function (DUF3014)